MTEMKLTRNSDFPWIKILFKKIDENRKKLVSIKKYYNKKRRSLGYRNNNDFVMKSNTINNEEHIKVCMLNAKYTRAMYLYIIRNYYNIYSFQRSIKKFMNVTLNRGDFLRNQCKDRIDDDTHSKKDKKYLQLWRQWRSSNSLIVTLMRKVPQTKHASQQMKPQTYKRIYDLMYQDPGNLSGFCRFWA